MNRLRRSARPAPPGASYERILRDQIGLAFPRGTVRVYLLPHEDAESRLRLETVNAVAGVRGTTFQCRSEGGTACSVLFGNLVLAPASIPQPDDWLPDPDTWREALVLGKGQRGFLDSGEDAPSPPGSIEPNVRRRLVRFRKRARIRLLGLALGRLEGAGVVPGTFELDLEESLRTKLSNPLDPEDQLFEELKGLGY